MCLWMLSRTAALNRVLAQADRRLSGYTEEGSQQQRDFRVEQMPLGLR